MAAEARISDEPAVAVGRLERLATKLSGAGRKEFNRSFEHYLSQEREKQDAEEFDFASRIASRASTV
jgi:hypothetical protein